jgi:hypothetical protein
MDIGWKRSTCSCRTGKLTLKFDGFHPSQIVNSMGADFIYEWLQKEHPDVLGPVNPNNAEIERLFGNQGGY